MECNGECVVTFGAGRWGNLSGRKVKFGIKMELMEEEEEENAPQFPTPQPVNTADSFTGTTKLLKMMRLKQGLRLIQDNIYSRTKIETLRNRLVCSVEKVADWILHRTILLIMTQEIQVNLTGKIGCRHFTGVSTEKENPGPQNINKFHEMSRIVSSSQADQEIEEEEGRCNAPGGRDAFDVKEEPAQAEKEDDAYELQRAEKRLIGRAREKYDFGKRPERDTIIQVEEESLRLIPEMLSRKLQNPQRNNKNRRRDEDSVNGMQGVNINRTCSVVSTSSNIQTASKNNNPNNSADWYFRRHRSKRRGGM